jgi:hypothetical protein
MEKSDMVNVRERERERASKGLTSVIRVTNSVGVTWGAAGLLGRLSLLELALQA